MIASIAHGKCRLVTRLGYETCCTLATDQAKGGVPET